MIPHKADHFWSCAPGQRSAHCNAERLLSCARSCAAIGWRSPTLQADKRDPYTEGLLAGLALATRQIQRLTNAQPHAEGRVALMGAAFRLLEVSREILEPEPGP